MANLPTALYATTEAQSEIKAKGVKDRIKPDSGYSSSVASQLIRQAGRPRQRKGARTKRSQSKS